MQDFVHAQSLRILRLVEVAAASCWHLHASGIPTWESRGRLRCHWDSESGISNGVEIRCGVVSCGCCVPLGFAFRGHGLNRRFGSHGRRAHASEKAAFRVGVHSRGAF